MINYYNDINDFDCMAVFKIKKYIKISRLNFNLK